MIIASEYDLMEILEDNGIECWFENYSVELYCEDTEIALIEQLEIENLNITKTGSVLKLTLL